MAKLSDVTLDVDLIEEGAEFEYAEGWIFTIARINNKKMVARMERDQGLRALGNSRRSSVAIDKKRTTSFKKAVAETVVQGWTGLEKDDGSEDAFSPARCLEIFMDPGTEHIFNWVCECGQEEEAFRKELVEEAVGN